MILIFICYETILECLSSSTSLQFETWASSQFATSWMEIVSLAARTAAAFSRQLRLALFGSIAMSSGNSVCWTMKFIGTEWARGVYLSTNVMYDVVFLLVLLLLQQILRVVVDYEGLWKFRVVLVRGPNNREDFLMSEILVVFIIYFILQVFSASVSKGISRKLGLVVNLVVVVDSWSWVQ